MLYEVITETTQKQQPKRSEKKGLSYREKQEVSSLEEKMETLTEKIALLEESFGHAEVTEDGTLAERTEKYHTLRDDLEEAEARWLELAEKM